MAGFFTLVGALAAPVDLGRLTVKSRQGEPFLATATLASPPEERVAAECLSMGPESDAPGSDMPFLSQAILKLNTARSAVEISTNEPISAPALALVLRVQCAGGPLYARHFSALIPPAGARSLADRHKVRKSSRAKSLSPEALAAGPSATQRRSRTLALPVSATLAAEAIAEAPAAPRNTITLRRALELGDKPGPQECSQLMPLCAATIPSAAQLTPALDDKVRTLESGVKELHLRQDNIDQQLQRLEQSLQALDRAVNSAPASAPVQPAPPPKVELRTVVKSEPISWTIWLGLAGLIVAAAIGGFASGRRASFPRRPAEPDEQLERMLATAANAMRELESAPGPIATRELPAAERRGASGLAPDAQASQPSAGADLELKDRAPSPLCSAGLPNNVLYEMDQALDNTRSMVTDEDRFIALGRIQNALSLLQFQIQKNPKARGSWIKLMAIYRQERMDVELEKAARDFRKNFPDESPPVG